MFLQDNYSMQQDELFGDLQIVLDHRQICFADLYQHMLVENGPMEYLLCFHH